MGVRVRIVSGGVTDVGRVRTNNEDCYRIVAPQNLFVLADGMGGEAHGEVASALAVETVVKHCLDADANPASLVLGEMQPGWSTKTKRLSTAVHLANENIFKSAEENPERHGMGATLTAAWIDGTKLSIAHVGDSRAYLLRSGSLLQLTRDHSLVAEQVRRGILTAAEAEESEMQSVLLRALGAQAEMAALEEIEMPKLSLMFGDKIVKEVPVGNRPVTIGRSPDNDLPVDNLAVSNHHAKVYFEAGRMVVEDLDSLNGTFVNDLRVERATLHDGDNIHIGKHKIKVDTSGDAPVPWDTGRKTAAPRIDETMVLDTKERRQMLQQAAAMGESMQFASTRVKVPTLVVLSGNTDQKEYVLTNRLTVIGKSGMATIRLQGWFKPRMAAQINQRDDGYYLGPGDKVPSVNGRPIRGPVRLNDGDLIEVSGVRLNFIFRE